MSWVIHSTDGRTGYFRGTNGKVIGGGATPSISGFTVRPYSETIDAPVMSSPPTITDTGLTFSTRSWEGASRTYWDSPNLRTRGLHPEPVAAGSTGTTYAKQAIQTIGPANMPWAVETLHVGSRLGVVVFRTVATGGEPRYRVFVDGKPVAANVVTMANTSFGGSASIVLNFGSTATRHVRVELQQAALWGLDHDPSDTLAAPALTTPTLGILGDSWVEGTLESGDVRLDTMAWMTGRILDAPTYVAGYGGTGYKNGDTQTPPRHYGGEGRVLPWVAAAPDVLVIFGSINDNAADPKSLITDRAATLYSRLATDLPGTKLIVVGPQSYNTASNTSTQNLANRNAVKAAVDAAPNVIGFVDPMAETWITGTGNTTNPTGDGNADIYHNGANLAHLSKAGNRYYAEKLAAAIAAIAPST